MEEAHPIVLLPKLSGTTFFQEWDGGWFSHDKDCLELHSNSCPQLFLAVLTGMK